MFIYGQRPRSFLSLVWEYQEPGDWSEKYQWVSHSQASLGCPGSSDFAGMSKIQKFLFSRSLTNFPVRITVQCLRESVSKHFVNFVFWGRKVCSILHMSWFSYCYQRWQSHSEFLWWSQGMSLSILGTLGFYGWCSGNALGQIHQHVQISFQSLGKTPNKISRVDWEVGCIRG